MTEAESVKLSAQAEQVITEAGEKIRALIMPEVIRLDAQDLLPPIVVGFDETPPAEIYFAGDDYNTPMGHERLNSIGTINGLCLPRRYGDNSTLILSTKGLFSCQQYKYKLWGEPVRKAAHWPSRQEASDQTWVSESDLIIKELGWLSTR